MPGKFESSTRQAFYDVAKRRAVEAEMLLTVPHKPCDGAVTCGLLAAECALKATLLHGHTANTPDDLPETIRKAAFEGKSGHVIRFCGATRVHRCKRSQRSSSAMPSTSSTA